MRDAELDDAVGRHGDGIDAFHPHAAAHRADQSGDDAHQDGLTGAVGPITATATPAILRPCKRIEAARTCPTTCRTGFESGQPQRTTTTVSDWCRSADPAAPSCMSRKRLAD